jgi:hypothetical protein
VSFNRPRAFGSFQQRGDRLIDFRRILGVLHEQIRVLIPLVAVGALNEACIGFGQTAREQTLSWEIGRLRVVQASDSP